MATCTSVLRQIRGTVLRNGDGLSDAELLGRYLAQRDGDAFEALVRRHGAMVLGVCRRVLDQAHDAEDAFQATFLVLVRKAHSIVPRESVGHWLYGVAYRTALKARSMNVRRQVKERQAKDMPRHENGKTVPDLEPLLDQELARLPAKYQVPLVLCHLEGKSKKEVARQLGVPEGTVSSRLARGRDLLRQRLCSRGLALTAATLTTALSHCEASASVPFALLDSTVHAASLFAAGKTAAPLVSAKVAALTEGVLKTMFLTKLKIVTALFLTLGLALSGAGFVTHAVLADSPKPEAKNAAADGDKPKAKGDEKAADNKPPKPPGGNLGRNAVVDAVDAEKGTITLAVKDKEGNVTKKTLDVAKDATIRIDGKDAKLADVKQGAQVQVTVARPNKEDPPVVTGIQIGAAPAGTKPAGENTPPAPKPEGNAPANTPKPAGNPPANTPKPEGTNNSPQPPK